MGQTLSTIIMPSAKPVIIQNKAIAKKKPRQARSFHGITATRLNAYIQHKYQMPPMPNSNLVDYLITYHRSTNTWKRFIYVKAGAIQMRELVKNGPLVDLPINNNPNNTGFFSTLIRYAKDCGDVVVIPIDFETHISLAILDSNSLSLYDNHHTNGATFQKTTAKLQHFVNAFMASEPNHPIIWVNTIVPAIIKSDCALFVLHMIQKNFKTQARGNPIEDLSNHNEANCNMLIKQINKATGGRHPRVLVTHTF